MDGATWLTALQRDFSPSGDLAADVDALFAAYGREVTREHVPRVAHEALRLARRFGVDPLAAKMASSPAYRCPPCVTCVSA